MFYFLLNNIIYICYKLSLIDLIVYICFIYDFHIYSLDEKLCVGQLPKFYGKAVKCWQNEKEEVLETVTSVLKVGLISDIWLIF